MIRVWSCSIYDPPKAGDVVPVFVWRAHGSHGLVPFLVRYVGVTQSYDGSWDVYGDEWCTRPWEKVRTGWNVLANGSLISRPDKAALVAGAMSEGLLVSECWYALQS